MITIADIKRLHMTDTDSVKNAETPADISDTQRKPLLCKIGIHKWVHGDPITFFSGRPSFVCARCGKQIDKWSQAL